MYIKQSMKKKRDTTTNVKHAESIEGVRKRKKKEARPRYLIQIKYYYLKRQKRHKKMTRQKKMTKNVQCRNGYVNHWEAQPPYITNYKFS